MTQVSTQRLAEFAGAVYGLLSAAFSVKAEATVCTCLQILINLTFDSCNISMSLMSQQGFRTLLMAMMGDPNTCQDSVWLFFHVCSDQEIEFDSLQQATILELLAQML